MSGSDWQFRAVSPENWDDMAALFEGRGGPRQCWCMMWRSDADGAAARPDPADRRAAMERLVAARQQVGLLGYDQGIPVAWVSLAPRPLFGKSLSPTDPDSGLWSLTCFFIRADRRKQAGFAALLAAAEDFARQQGATAIEAYPVAPDSPSYRFSGFVPNFERAGFAKIGTAGSRRHVLRKALGPAGP